MLSWEGSIRILTLGLPFLKDRGQARRSTPTEIDLGHVQGGPSDEQPLAVYLAPRQVGLVIQWGEHVWAADFRVGR